MPRLANLLRFGVLIGDLESSSEMLSFMSSMTMNRTFGFAALALIKVNGKTRRRSKRRIMVATFECLEIVLTEKCTQGALPTRKDMGDMIHFPTRKSEEVAH